MFLRILNTAQPNSPLQNISDDILMNKDVFTAGSGQREPPRLVLEVGGTSTLQAAMPGKLKSPRPSCKYITVNVDIQIKHLIKKKDI